MHTGKVIDGGEVVVPGNPLDVVYTPAGFEDKFTKVCPAIPQAVS